MKASSCSLFLCLFVMGCGMNSAPPNAHRSSISSHYDRPAQKPVYVEFLGDSQTIGLLTYAHTTAQELSWMCSACQPSATSSDLLAALPGVIALHPDAIHIMTGDLEIVAPGTNRAAPVMNNIDAMVSEI